MHISRVVTVMSAVLLVSGSVLAGAGLASAEPTTPGFLDVSYGRLGVARMPVPAGSQAMTIARLADGRTLVLVDWVGPRGRHLPALFRLAPNGAIDRSFGTAGSVVIRDVGWFAPRDMVIQADGDILLVGNVRRGADRLPGVLRLTREGNLDRSLGLGGVVTPKPVPGWFSMEAATASGDGLVFVGAQASAPGGLSVGVYGSYRNGAIVANGYPIVGQPSSRSSLRGVAAVGDGTFIATGAFHGGGPNDNGYLLIKFDAALRLVEGFASGVLVDPKEGCQFDMADVVMQGAKNIVAGTSWSCAGQVVGQQVAVARQLPNGLADDPFGAGPGEAGEGAIALGPVNRAWWGARAIAVDSQSRIIVIGTAYATAADSGQPGGLAITTPRPLSLRLNADGTQDDTYAENPLALRNSPWTWTGKDVVVTPRDDVLMLGTATNGTRTEVRVAKLLG
jgi:hypothetical protein